MTPRIEPINPAIARINDLFMEYNNRSAEIESATVRLHDLKRPKRTKNRGQTLWGMAMSNCLDLMLDRIDVLKRYESQVIVHPGDLRTFRRRYHPDAVKIEGGTEYFLVIPAPLPAEVTTDERTLYLDAAEKSFHEGVVGIIRATKTGALRPECPNIDDIYIGRGVRLI